MLLSNRISSLPRLRFQISPSTKSPPPSESLPPRAPSSSQEADDTTILYQAVKSLYDLSGNVKDVYDKHYVPDTASFIDPLIMVTNSTSDCIGQFRALRGLFSKAEIETRSVTRGENKLVIDWKITYYPRGLPSLCAMTMPTITILTLVGPDEGTPERGTGSLRVAEHVDHWSVHELISSVPVVSFVYNTFWRPVVGKGSSVLTNALYDLVVAVEEGPEEEGVGKEGVSPIKWYSEAVKAGGEGGREGGREGGGVGTGTQFLVEDETKASD
jgi:hypothetical protein